MAQSLFQSNRICQLFQIDYPIIQAGMVWCSGWKLASAVSNAGGLGLIGAGSMYPEVLAEHIIKAKQATKKPFGVNVPLLYPDIDKIMDVIVQHKVQIVFTSAGNPATYTDALKAKGIKVVHVVSSKKFAIKAMNAGVDAVVAEGFEAGGHNGREETTTLCLIPMVRDAIDIPLIAAGGIGDGRAMAAAFALGADAVQVGSRFAASEESSAHIAFKQEIVKADEGATELVMKQVTPVRLLKNQFYQQVKSAEMQGATTEELKAILGKRRAKLGMFEGDLADGELEIGQIAAQIKAIEPAAQVLQDILLGFKETLKKLEKV
jgi:enoyl-[acyl-carrier protein] reductase II